MAKSNAERQKAWRDRQRAKRLETERLRNATGLEERRIFVTESDWNDFVVPLMQRLATDKDGVLDPVLYDAFLG